MEVFVQASTGNASEIATVTIPSLISQEVTPEDPDLEEAVFEVFEAPTVPFFSFDPPNMVMELLSPFQLLEIPLPDILDAGEDFCRMIVFSETFGEMTWNYCGTKTKLIENPIQYDAQTNSLLINVTQE